MWYFQKILFEFYFSTIFEKLSLSVSPSVLKTKTLEFLFKPMCLFKSSNLLSFKHFNNPANPAAPDSPEMIFYSPLL
mgnify:CR=1 FL=1